MRSVLVMILCAPPVLAGCNGGGKDSGTPPQAPTPPQGPGPATTLVIQSGNGQVVDQHSVVPQALTVRAIDVRGNGISNIEIKFSAAAGSAFIRPNTAITDAEGLAAWAGYVHASGQQIIQASTPGLPSAMFTLGVTPSAHLYDGVYNCDMWFADGTPREIRMPPEARSVYLRIGIGEGVVGNASPDLINGGAYYSKSFDEANGAITAVQRASLDNQRSFTGTMHVDAADQRGIGSGVWDTLYHLKPLPPDQQTDHTHGTWKCDRE